MRSETHPVAAAMRVPQFAHSTRQPPCGGRRMERVHREMRGAATVTYVSERIAEQLSRENSSEC
eukprot:5489993-Lingulodinium_polyedra.AAC.1